MSDLAAILQDNIVRHYDAETHIPLYTRAIYAAFSLDVCEYLVDKLLTLPAYVQISPLYGASGQVPLKLHDGTCHHHVVHADNITVKAAREIRVHSFNAKNFEARARNAVYYGALCFTVIKACLAENREGLFVHFAPHLLPYVTPDQNVMRIHLQFAFFRSHNPRHIKE